MQPRTHTVTCIQARQYGRGLRAKLTSGSPCVLCVEKPYLAGLIEAFEEGDNDVAPPPPFVLLAVNGGDEPFTAGMQAQVSRLRVRGLRACFANNLHAPADL